MDLPQTITLDLTRENRLARDKHEGGVPAAERDRGGAGAQSAWRFP